MDQGFAVWITGLPASGKSSLARELAARLRGRGVFVVVLESDALRTVLTPEPTYAPDERDRFYSMLAGIGELITMNGINVIFDATANLRTYRGEARRRIPRFIEVYIECPLETCRKRDPKGIYRRAELNVSGTVPGVQAVYEPPVAPEVLLDCEIDPGRAAEEIGLKLALLGFLPL